MTDTLLTFFIAGFLSSGVLGALIFVIFKIKRPKSSLSWWELPCFILLWVPYFLEALHARYPDAD